MTAPARAPAPRRTVAVTGAAGLLGGVLCAAFAAWGWEVRALVRDPAAYTGPGRPFLCDLPDRLDPAAFEGADVVIHAAYAMRSRGPAADRRVNIDGSRRVFAAARAAAVRRLVFVSTVSAHDHAEGFYGRSKLALERELDTARDLIIRPGLILSTRAGLFVRMLHTVTTTGLAPMFGGGRQIIQTVHVDDLAAAFRRAVELDLTGTLIVCEPDGLPMRDLFRLMGRLTGRRVRIVPLPFGPVILALRAAEAIGLALPVSADNLRGLRSMRPMDPRESLARLGLTLRTARESLRDLLGPGARA